MLWGTTVLSNLVLYYYFNSEGIIRRNHTKIVIIYVILNF